MEKRSINNLKLNNDKLEAAVSAMQAANNKDNLARLIQEIRNAQLLVPVDFPPNMSDEDKMKFAQGKLAPEKAPKMVPMILQNSSGDRFAPIYTSPKQIKGGLKYKAILTVPFKEVIRVSEQKGINVKGVIINPETNNLILRPQFMEAVKNIEANVPQKREVKMTKDQFDVFARKQVEAGLLPKVVFAKKGAFIEELDDKGGKYIYDVYKQPYGDKVAFPYTEEDFDVMVLSIDDDTTVASIEVPSKKLAPGLALSIYVVWNSAKEQIFYFLIEKGQPDQSNVLCGINADGKREELMTAPAVGSELFAVLDLVNEEE